MPARSAADTYTSGACSARPGHPAPANGNHSRKQTSADASRAGLAPGHLPALRCPRASPACTAIRAALWSRLSLMPVLPCASSASWRIFPEMFQLLPHRKPLFLDNSPENWIVRISESDFFLYVTESTEGHDSTCCFETQNTWLPTELMTVSSLRQLMVL